jgi:hypothetical protein
MRLNQEARKARHMTYDRHIISELGWTIKLYQNKWFHIRDQKQILVSHWLPKSIVNE